MISVARREIFRYLGYGMQEPDEATLQIAEACLQDLQRKANPKHIHKTFPLIQHGNTLKLGALTTESRNLEKNLRGCSEVVLFAATLGAEVDRLLARWAREQMSRAVVLQAAAAAYIEAYCDICQRDIEAEAKNRGLYARPRFSPGYGDFAILHQQDFTRILDTSRRIGLTLTEGFTLAPSKSVTAVIGLSQVNQNCHKTGCDACEKIDCTYRRS